MRHVDGFWLVVENRVQRINRGRAHPRMLAGQHLVEDRAERKQVAA
jgi:hypothetical protein